MPISSSVGGTAEVSSHGQRYERAICCMIPLLGLCYLSADLDRINTGIALARSLANIAGLASHSLVGWIFDFIGNGAIALLGVVAALPPICLLVIALLKHLVNRWTTFCRDRHKESNLISSQNLD